MPEQLTPGNGGETLISPAGMLLAVLVMLAMIILRRKYIIIPFLAGVAFIPLSQVFVIAGLHFMVTRVLILLGCARAIVGATMGRREWHLKLNAIDYAFILCWVSGAISYAILWGSMTAFINRMGVLISTVGMYLVLRVLIRDWEDVDRATRALAVVMTLLALCMVAEQVTGRNVFALFGGIAERSDVRSGRIRSHADFSNAILAGTFGATMFPLFIGLWWRETRQKRMAVVGMLAAAIMVVTSASSTPVGGWFGGLVGLCLWPLRRHMRIVRWGIVFSMLVIQMFMQNPIWHMITRIDLAGGSTAWHRQLLIDQFVRHFGEWWLIGTKGNAAWGLDMWDVANQFVATGVNGGLLALIFLILTITRGFRAVGLVRKAGDGDFAGQIRVWTLGASLFAHVIAFIGILYFDQTIVAWCLTLAMISAAVSGKTAHINRSSDSDSEEWFIDTGVIPENSRYPDERDWAVPGAHFFDEYSLLVKTIVR